MPPDGGVDLNGGPFYSKYDRVRVESVWRQTLGKETDLRTTFRDVNGNNGFQMNLANRAGSSGLLTIQHSHNRIEIVTEKEHKQTPVARASIKGMDPNSFEVQAIRHTEKRPADKWDLATTMSQDVGWLLAKPCRADTLSKGRKNWGTRSSAGLINGARSTSDLAALGSSTIGSPAGGSASRMSATDGFFNKSMPMPTSEKALARVRSAPEIPCGVPAKELSMINNRRWYRPRGKCDVTTYAESYVKLLHHDPFNQAAAGR